MTVTKQRFLARVALVHVPGIRRPTPAVWTGLALAAAVAVAAVSHGWQYVGTAPKRLEWFLAVWIGTAGLYFLARRWVRWIGRVWAVEPVPGRVQAVLACAVAGALLNFAAEYRLGPLGNNFWVHSPAVRPWLKAVLWISDAFLLATACGTLLTLFLPPVPRLEPLRSISPPRHIGRVVMATAVGLLLVNGLVVAFVSREWTAHYWDFAGYWLICSSYADAWSHSLVAAVDELFSSIRTDEYNLLPAALPAIILSRVGDGRLAYELVVANTYGAAVVLATVAAVARVVRPGRFASFLWPALLAATTPIIWAPTLRGYLDLGGVAIALVVLTAYLSRPARDLRWQQVLTVGVGLVGLALFRRWYCFWVVAFLAVAVGEAAVATARRLASRSGAGGWIGDWRPAVVAGGIALFLLASFAWPTVVRMAGTDYADAYVGYKATAGPWVRLHTMLADIGYGYVAAFVAAAAVVVAHPPTRRAGVFLLVTVPVIHILFHRVQDMGWHHRMLFGPSFLLLVGAAGARLVESARGAGRVAVLLVLTALSGFGALLAFEPALNGIRLRLTPIGPVAPTYPDRRPDADVLLALADDANREAAARGTSFLIVSSSAEFNQTHVLTVHRSLGLTTPSPCRQVIMAEVDKVNGFPDALFRCGVAFVADPPQIHLRAEEQQVVRATADSLLNGTDVGRAFRRLPETYTLMNGIVVHAFVRDRPLSRVEVDQFCDKLRRAHPDRPSVFTPRGTPPLTPDGSTMLDGR